MSYEEFIQRCSSDFVFFMAFMAWFSFFTSMAWDGGKSFVSFVIRLIKELCDCFKRKS